MHKAKLQSSYSRKTFGQLLSACAAIRDLVNENMFANALQMVIMNRTDLGNSIPLLHQYIPRESDLKDALESSQDYQWQGRPGGRGRGRGRGRSRAGRGRGRSRASRDLVIDINWNRPPFQTYPSSEPESNLWYIREDPEANSHHRHWHLIYSTEEFLHN